MTVVEISPSFSEYVVTDEGGWNTYRRFNEDNWEILMGDSWEDHYDCAKVEAAYQAAKSKDIGLR